MESKYYTPEIEEFHIGFEYLDKIRVVDMSNIPVGMSISEYITDNPGHETDDEYIYQTIIVDDIYNVPFLYTKYADGSTESVVSEFVKVKYLDKNDIESLGWKLVKDYSDCLIFQKIGEFDYELTFSFDKEDLFNIRIEDLMIMPSGKTDIRTLFLGDIKNKSELKKLMQMLKINIIENINETHR